MGILCAVVGAVVGAWVALTATGDGYEVFAAGAPVAAFLTGTFCWWLLIARSGNFAPVRAATAGALAAVLGHLLCWYLLILGSFLWYLATGSGDSLGGPPLNPLQGFPAAFVYGAFSLLFYGWVTVPAGALIGLFLSFVQSRRVVTQPG